MDAGSPMGTSTSPFCGTGMPARTAERSASPGGASRHTLLPNGGAITVRPLLRALDVARVHGDAVLVLPDLGASRSEWRLRGHGWWRWKRRLGWGQRWRTDGRRNGERWRD